MNSLTELSYLQQFSSAGILICFDGRLPGCLTDADVTLKFPSPVVKGSGSAAGMVDLSYGSLDSRVGTRPSRFSGGV